MSSPSLPDDSSSHNSPRAVGQHSSNPSIATNNDETQHRIAPPSSTTALPPLAAIASLPLSQNPTSMPPDAASPTASRPFGMHSILNPFGDASQGSVGISRPPMSPGRSVSAIYGSIPPPSMSPRSKKGGERPSSRQDHPPVSENRPPRRILTPKSPATRAVSHGARMSPSATVTGRYAAGPSEGRIYTAEPGSGPASSIPPLPPLSMAPQNPGGLTTEAQGGPGRHGLHPSNGSYANSAPPKRPGSPDGLHHSLERGRSSPFRSIAHDGPHALPLPHGYPTLSESRAPAISRNYGGQTTYQLQLPDTEHGTIGVPLEIDYQHASKVADEKRKRNAGASARFRQRRKEKEQAANHTISNLQRQLQEAQDDRDFYIGERNFFRDLAARNVPANQLPPRPASPQTHRMQTQISSADTQSSLEYARRRAPEEGVQSHQRRMTGDYPSNYTSPSSVAPPSYLYPQSTAPVQLVPAPTGTTGFPNTRGGQQQATGSAAPPRSQTYDPFRRDILR